MSGGFWWRPMWCPIILSPLKTKQKRFLSWSTLHFETSIYYGRYCAERYRHSKSRFFLRYHNFSFLYVAKKKCKNITRSHLICVKHEEKTVKEVKMHNFLVCASKYQDFMQNPNFFARLHDRDAETFRNSGKGKPSHAVGSDTTPMSVKDSLQSWRGLLQPFIKWWISIKFLTKNYRKLSWLQKWTR